MFCSVCRKTDYQCCMVCVNYIVSCVITYNGTSISAFHLMDYKYVPSNVSGL